MRTFIAIRIPENQSLAEPVSLLKSERKMKTYGPGGLHLTLCFIGNITEDEAKEVIGAVDDATEGLEPFNVSVRGMGTFPGRKGPRILWVGAESGGVLEKLAGDISAGLSERNISHDRKKFTPHITVGRSKDINGSELAGKIAEENKDREFFSFPCDKVTVYSSVLKPEGPVYKAVYEKEL